MKWLVIIIIIICTRPININLTVAFIEIKLSVHVLFKSYVNIDLYTASAQYSHDCIILLVESDVRDLVYVLYCSGATCGLTRASVQRQM